MPPETQGEVVIDGHRTESTWYANTVRVARYGGDFNVIQDAIDYCNAIGGEWTIELYTGAYREGDITHTGVANITIKGMGLERAVIAPTVVPATAVIISGAILTLEGIEVIAPGTTRPALRVEGGTCTCLGQSEFLCVGAGNAIEQVAGQLILRQCRVPDDIDLSTAGCDLAIYHSDIRGDINASGAGLAHTIWVESCYLHNHNVNVTATGATTCTVANSTYLDQITNAGTGAFTINGTSVSRINQTNAAGTTTVYGGYVWQITRAVGSVVWWLNGSIIKVLPSGTITDGVIGHALTAAAAGNIVIRLVIGTYEEDNLVVPDNVQITGEGKNFQSQIIINSANPIITFGNVTVGIRRVGITQNGAASAIVINNAGADIYLSECQVSALAAQDAVNMTAGSANLHDCVIARGDIDLSTADCTLEMDRCKLNGDIVTADAFNHAITLDGCDLNNGSITSLATGAVTMHISRSANIATIQDAGLLGTVTLNFSEVGTVDKDGTSTWTIISTSITTTVRNDNAVGGITIRGGSLAACGASVGSIVWYTPSDRHLFVLSGMKIAHALAVATAGILIDIDEGTFAETGLALVDGVDLEGEGHTKTLITDNTGADIFTAGNITTTLRKLRLDHSGGGVGACLALNNAGSNVHLNQVEILGAATPTNAVEMTAGTLEAHECYFNAGDIDLSADACTLTLVNCLIQAGDIDTAGDFNHTLIISYCNFTGRSLVNAATGATTLTVRFCSDILAIADAGLLGTSTVESCYVGTITKTGTSTWTITNTHIETALLNSNATGDITVYGGVIFAVTDSTGSIVWYSNEDMTLEVITGMRIAHALAEAGANSIIKIGPGTYAESNLQLTANVDLVGEDPEECQIVANSAAQPILKAVTNVTLSNLTVGNTNAGNAAIQVNPGNLIIVRNCVIYGTAGGECVDLQGGSIQAHETHFSVGVIHCDTQICTVTMDNCEVSVAFNTSAARAHVLTFMGCDFGGNNLASAATGATTLSMRGCSNVGTISNAGSGTFTIMDSGVDTVTASSTGTFIITGGRVLACGGATASIIWKTHAQQYEVIAGMLIQHAVNAAAANRIWVIPFDGGDNEPNIGDEVSTPTEGGFYIVDYEVISGGWAGDDAAGYLYIQKPGDSTCGWVDNEDITNDTQSNLLAGDGALGVNGSPSALMQTILIHPGLYDEGAIVCSEWVNLKGIGPKGSVVIYRNDDRLITLNDNVQLQNFTLRLGTPTATRVMVWGGVAAANTRMSDVVFEITTPGAVANALFRFEDGDTDVIIERCSCLIGGTGATEIISHENNAGATIRLVDNDFTLNNPNGCHIFSNRVGTWIGKGNRWAGTCSMFNASGGTFTFDHDAMICTGAWANAATTMTLRHCTIEAPVVAGNTAIVRLKNCSYKAIQRTGTGNIVDESPWLSDAPWHVEKWSWQAALANSQVAVRGGAVDGGSSQVHLPVTDGAAASRSAVEATTEVVGTLGTEFTPAKTPRFITQISVDDFAAAATNFKMFFGLRETLGNNVPVANEDHAGFEWDGAAWNAVSCLGANKSTTGLTTPTAGTHVQLEVIVISGAQVDYYLDGILVHTETTNIPAAVLDWQHLVEALGNSSANTVNVTVRNGGCQECPA